MCARDIAYFYSRTLANSSLKSTLGRTWTDTILGSKEIFGDKNVLRAGGSCLVTMHNARITAKIVFVRLVITWGRGAKHKLGEHRGSDPPSPPAMGLGELNLREQSRATEK